MTAMTTGTKESNREAVLILQVGTSTDGMSDLYESNVSFIYYMAKKLGVPSKQLDDFKQTCYFALSDAVRSFKPLDNFSFLTFYGRYIMHHHHRNRLLMDYPVRLPRYAYKKLKDYVNNVDGLDVGSAGVGDMARVRELTRPVVQLETRMDVIEADFSQTETAQLNSTLWGEVSSVLDEKNMLVIRGRYLENRTLEDIGHELGIGKERVRQREIRSLNKLRKSDVLRRLAVDYYSISI